MRSSFNKIFLLTYVDEVHAIGWNQLITFYRKAVDKVKKITGRENEREAVSEFKTRLKSFSLCLNKQPFPLNESNNEAFQKCRTKRGGKYFPLLRLREQLGSFSEKG